VVAGLGAWSHHRVSETSRANQKMALNTVLDADITALEIWLGKQRTKAELWAEDPELRAIIGRLAARAQDERGARDRLLAAPELATLRTMLSPLGRHRKRDRAGTIPLVDHARGFVVVDRKGLFLAGDRDDEIGSLLAPRGMKTLARIVRDQEAMVKPFVPDTMRRGREEPDLEPDMLVIAPVRDPDGSILAVLAFAIDPDQEFTRILNAANLGESGETYAFDRKGYIISRPSRSEELAALGLVQARGKGNPLPRLKLLDPGGDLTRGFRPEAPRAEWPLTRMAESAVAGLSGTNLEGYRNFRGERVVGAWRWLEPYGFGVATEVRQDRMQAILRPVTLSYWVLTGLLIAVLAGVLIALGVIHLLNRRIDQVKQLGQYTLIEKIGEGGMGAVYRARHAMLRRPTAVKTLKSDIASPSTIARFESEVQLTAELTHPNTIEIFDYGRTPDGIFYYAMEFLDGPSLSQLVDRSGPIPPSRVVHILKQVTGSLEEAHSVNLLHRDVKPANVILCRRGGREDVVKLVDFGLVKDILHPDDATRTSPNLVAGTPGYVAPERLKNARYLDPRSDLYSVGAVAYYLLTGTEVFEGDTAAEVCQEAVARDPVAPSERLGQTLPADLERLVLDLLARDPAGRPAGASALLERLEALEVPPWTREDARRWWEANADWLRARSAAAEPVPAGSAALHTTLPGGEPGG